MMKIGGLISACLFLLLAMSCGVLFWFRHSPTLVSHKDRAAVDPGDGLFVIFNPIRDRSPEVSAEAFLRLLRSGDCKTIESVLKENPNASYVCQKEIAHKLTGWELADRKDKLGDIVLFFKVGRADYPADTYGNVWVTVRQNAGHWHVINYEAWY